MGTVSKSCFLFLILVFANCSAYGHDVEGDDTVLHLLDGNTTGSQFDNDGTDFDLFSYLFTAAGREHRLEDISGDVTILAPDDNAFRRAVGDLGLATTSELETYENFILYLMRAYWHPFDILKRILYYHIIPGEFNSTLALQMPSFATWDERLRITRDGMTLIDRDPEMPNPSFDTDRLDIQASNGIIHVIDYVLFPEAMRKLDLSKADDECTTPEPTFEETELDMGTGSIPGDGVSHIPPIDQSSSETHETGQTMNDAPVGPMPPATGISISPNPGPQELTPPDAVSHPLPSGDRPPEEAVYPSQEVIVESPEDTGDREELMLNTTSQTSSQVSDSTPLFSSDDTPEAETPLEEDASVPMASTSPLPSPETSPADGMGPQTVSMPELPLEQEASSSSSPMNPDESPETVVDDEDPAPFVGPILGAPEQTAIATPAALEPQVTVSPEESPEVIIDDEGPFTFPFVGQLPETPE